TNPFARTGNQDSLLLEVELKIFWDFHGWHATSSALGLNATSIVWRLAFGVWRLAFGVWRLAFSVQRSAFGGSHLSPFTSFLSPFFVRINGAAMPTAIAATMRRQLTESASV